MTQQEIAATEQIMRIAVNHQDHVDALLGYYRDEIDSFNEQRVQWILRYEQCCERLRDRALLQEESQKLRDALNEAQVHAGVSKAVLQQERDRYMSKSAKLEQVRELLQNEKERLRQLTSVVRPIDGRSRGERSKTNSSVGSSVGSQLTELELELINMVKDQEIKVNYQRGSISRLKDELELLTQEHGNRGNQCTSEYKEALNRLSTLEEKHFGLVAEYFRFKSTYNSENQQIQEQSEILRLKNFFLAQKLKQTEQANTDEAKTVNAQVKKRNDEFKAKYDSELRSKEQHLSFLREQHVRLTEVYTMKIKKLSDELKSASQAIKDLNKRTKLEAGSIRSQIKILKSRLSSTVAHSLRQDILSNGSPNCEDDSQQDETLERVRQINGYVDNLKDKIGVPRPNKTNK